MKYRFYGDKLELIRYELTLTDGKVYEVASETERDELLVRYPNAEVTEVDNTDCEWLDGMTFSQEQQRSGEVEKAIEMGQEAYESYIMDSDPTYQMLELDMRVALLEMGVDLSDLSVD